MTKGKTAMYELDEEEVPALRAIADRIREEGSTTGYGRFPGGDPRDFFPDAEVCTAEELESHKQACELIEQGAIITLVQDSCHAFTIDPAGKMHVHGTKATFGLGTYTYPDERAERLARDLDDWIDAMRVESDHGRP